MRKLGFQLLTGICLFLTPWVLKAQAKNPANAAVIGDKSSVPSSAAQSETGGAASATAIPNDQPPTTYGENLKKSEKEDEAKSDEESEKPFVPHWTGQLGLAYSSQPSQLGQGQITRDLTFTGTYEITESGHFFSLGLTGGQQKVEGADTNYGGMALNGGLGLGFFLPSLSLAMQVGSAALNSIDSTLTLNFQIFEPLTAGLLVEGGTESHQGPNPITQDTTTLVEIDSANISGGVVIGFVPWDFLSLSLTGQQEYSVTYQWQTLSQSLQKNLNQGERIPSVSLGADVTFLKDFVLELSGQVGQEFYPAGTVYSSVLKKTVTFAKPTTQNFSGFSMGLMYNFQ